MQAHLNFVPSKDSLKGRIILITGATDGIGKALAVAAAASGATVIAHGRSNKKLEAVDDAMKAAGGDNCALLPLDFEKAGPDEFVAMADAIEKNFGRLDGLVHNAAMLAERAPLQHHDVPKWLRAMHVNTNAAFILTRYCLPLLKQSEDASIVFNSCDIAKQARANWGAYLVSKWANEGMMHMLAEELDNTRIRVNSFDPGATKSRIRLQAFPAENREVLPEPAAVVAPFIYLLSGESKGVQGQSLSRNT